MNKNFDQRNVVASDLGSSFQGQTEELPFTVRLVRNEEQLLKAVHVRSEAYGKHLPELKEMLSSPEPVDKSQGTLVFLAELKGSQRPLGTLRIQTAVDGKLRIEDSISLPSAMAKRPRVGVTRFAVQGGPDSKLVRITLIKSLVQFCLAQQIEWIVIAARPPLDRMYTKLGYRDLYNEGALYPIVSAKGILHRVLALYVRDLERVTFERKHPLHDFFFRDFHPDIQIFSSVSSMWSTPRHRANGLASATDFAKDFALPIV